ncbi:uncharacterized protein [Montipora capricornis]|uniref:uncharacterized protein n=1 Tax=Montipora capricornis TaxID=246305 RepID=UPI0035F2192C
MAVRLFPWTQTVSIVLLASSSIFHLSKGECEDFTFENGVVSLSKWTKTGHAFDNQPTFGDNAHVRDPTLNSNVQGDWWIATFENRSSPLADGGYLSGDYPTGTLTSPKFLITAPKMSFLLGGGCAPGQIRVELLVDGKVARRAFADDCRERMRRKGWDVKPFKNKFGQIRLVDESRKGHINFDDFACIGHKEGFAIVDEPLMNVRENKSGEKNHNDLNSRTDNEFITAPKSSKPLIPPQNVPVNDDSIEDTSGVFTKPSKTLVHSAPLSKNTHSTVKKGPAENENDPNALLQGTKITISNLNTRGKGPHLRKPFLKITKPSTKLADNSSNNSLPTDDDIRNLTCKSFLVEIKTGKPWDNDFLFSSNDNYQSTRREIEVKILNIFEDDKDFRGASFSKFSSAEGVGGVKAYFILRFRAVGKFLGKLIDQLGPENITAAGCYMDTPAIVQCPGICPQSCAPSCQPSCCQLNASSAPFTPQQSAPVPVPQCASPCPISCAPACDSSCCQQPLSVSNTQQTVQPFRITVSQPQLIIEQPTQQLNQQPLAQAYAPQPSLPQVSQQVALTSSQCRTGCSANCAPSCSPSCCRFFDSSRRRGKIKNYLVTQSLLEEKN